MEVKDNGTKLVFYNHVRSIKLQYLKTEFTLNRKLLYYILSKQTKTVLQVDNTNLPFPNIQRLKKNEK